MFQRNVSQPEAVRSCSAMVTPSIEITTWLCFTFSMYSGLTLTTNSNCVTPAGLRRRVVAVGCVQRNAPSPSNQPFPNCQIGVSGPIFR